MYQIFFCLTANNWMHLWAWFPRI